MRRRLSVKTAREYLPRNETRLQVKSELKALGFEVFDSAGPVVTARGSVKRFTETFGGQLVKRTRKYAIPGSHRVRTETSIALREGSELPKPGTRMTSDALLIAVATRPRRAAPSVPPPVGDVTLHLPGDIAQLTRASATHRRSVGGDRATGNGVTVAVIDSGFADHPYYREHDYRITRIAASDVESDPSDDDIEQHGTYILAGVFACAPDVHVLAIKHQDPVTALNDAMARGANVVSLSWGIDLDDPQSLPLQQTIVTMMAEGVTFVAAAGNDDDINFPAMMREVIAVGGVAVGDDDSLTAWEGSSSFNSPLFAKRQVPDICGIASAAWMPIPLTVLPDGWDSMSGATSFATGQVAGVAALLLQKSPSLTPEEVRDCITSTATDVTKGESYPGHRARKGRDRATGFGLVNALDAWNSIP
jgi:subtilisin family serine protease